MADIKSGDYYPFVTPVRRRVRFKMAHDVLTEILQGRITGEYETSLPEDACVVDVCQDLYGEMADAFWVIVSSESFDVVPPGHAVPEIPPVLFKKKEPSE